MKKLLVETTPPIMTRKKGWWITVQLAKNILILNIFNNMILQARHCINVDNHEYMTLRDGKWHPRRIEEALGLKPEWPNYYSCTKVSARFCMSQEDADTIRTALAASKRRDWRMDEYDIIRHVETEYGRDKRERRERNRIDRVNAVMNRMPPIPEGIKEWINQRELQGEDYATKTGRPKMYACSKCGEKFAESELKRPDEKKEIRHNDKVICPACGREIRLIKRKKAVDIWTHFALVQPVDEKISVVRHFDVEIFCGGGRKQIGMDEAVRIVLHKDFSWEGIPCELYYNQHPRGIFWAPEGARNDGCFDNKHNIVNRQEYAGFLYDGGIEEAFKGTKYTKWTRLFTQMAAAGIKANYNKLMVSTEGRNFMDVVEMLFRGRFYRYLLETTENINIWNGAYAGDLRITGSSIEDVFKIGDRQKINRIRDKDGGADMACWMRWSELRKEKIADKVLQWLLQNDIKSGDIGWLSCRMSVEQVMNYIERQRRESYKGKTVKQVISQYEDYMTMCSKLQKDTTDEMVYRPRELKRRHDEAVAEIQLREAEIKADEYSRRFPGAEDVLKEIKGRYEYENEKYRIIVPNRLVEIVAEGRALHHCAGSSDRYFDRIMQRETYICFLRKKSEPELPYYTIEVEPGGTIRQHRGYLDEEPEIELVKPFLKEWQKALKKRLTEEDRRYAEVSTVKREQNIEELKAKNNTRVLKGLMEDFMEAM